MADSEGGFDGTTGIAVRAQVGRVAIESPATNITRKTSWDLDDTAFPLGMLDYRKDRDPEGENRTADLLKEVLQVALDLEVALGQTPGENAHDFLKFSELVSSMANILYVPQSEIKGESLSFKRQRNQYLDFDSYAVMYAPHNRELDGIKMHVGDYEALLKKDYGIPRKADVVFEIADRISGKTLVIDLFPSRYSFYGIRNKELTGADLEEAGQILSERTRGGRTLADQSIILDHARATFRYPSLNITLFDRDRRFVAGMHGEVHRERAASRRGLEGDYYGFNLSPAFSANGGKFSSIRAFLPVTLDKEELFRGTIENLSGLEIRKRQFGRTGFGTR